MKATITAALIVLCIGGCSTPQSDQLTPEQIAQITQEITAINDTMAQSMQQLNAKSSLRFLDDSPDFRFVEPNGRAKTYQQIEAGTIAMDSLLVARTLTTTKTEFPLVTQDVVVILNLGTDQQTDRAGNTYAADRVATTLVFRKKEGAWKIVFGQASAILNVIPAKK